MNGTSDASSVQENEDLVASLKRRLAKNKQFSSECCIYRVPERIYHGNERAYTPKVVSIGPIHRGKEALEAMEEHKFLYLESFLERTGLSVENYAIFAEEREETVRKLYAERFEDIKTREFVEMIILDVAFLVEIMFRNQEGVKDHRDRLFQKPNKIVDVRYDLMLLENQLPFFLLEDIFELAKLRLPQSAQHSVAIRSSLSAEKISLIQLTHKFFRFKAYMGERAPDDLLTRMTQQESKIMHFVDFFRKFHVPANIRSKTVIKTLTVPSATKLYEAGVKFEVGPTENLFDINFRGKTLVIPLLRIRRSMESFFLNVLAYEQLHKLEHYVNDYVFVLDRLVDSSKAVDLLTRKGLIETKLADNQDVVASIDSIVRGSILRREHFHFSELCDGLNRHLSDPWNKRLATIKHTHFSSPLTAFYVLVAAAIFILTLMQTICSCGVPFK